MFLEIVPGAQVFVRDVSWVGKLLELQVECQLVKDRTALTQCRANRATASPAVTSNSSSKQTLLYDIVPIARNFFEAIVFMN